MYNNMMINSDSIYNGMDLCSSSNSLFALNDTSSIGPYEKLLSMEFIKSKMMTNNLGSFVPIDLPAKSRKPPGDRRDTNLIVNYLPDGFYEKELFDLFSQAGSIVHHHIVRNKDNRSECYGFVDFEKPSDAEKAIELFDQYSIQNKKLKVQNAAEGLLLKEEERQLAINCVNNIGYNVEVKNAPFRWSIKDVRNVFGKYGELLKVYENVSEETNNLSEMKTKTFNLIYRYHTIATKVIKKKNKTPAEALWPLQLELSIVGQEIIEPPTPDINRPRHKYKTIVDQMTDSFRDNKLETNVENVFYQNHFENPTNYWTNSAENNPITVPYSSNGRPILKHKDNVMHLSNSTYQSTESFEAIDNWAGSNTVTGNSFIDNLLGPSNYLKSIWNPLEAVVHDISPQDIYVKTPLIPSRYRSTARTRFKANVYFKMENMQPSGSFHLRGMASFCCKAKLDGVQTIISSSGGNAGIAAAYACRLLKLRCIVVVPITALPNVICDLLKETSSVIQEGNTWKEAHAKAEQLVLVTPRSRLAHPFDDPLLWDGYESIIDEIISDMRDTVPNIIVLSVGGGGLLNGVVQGIHKYNLQRSTALLGLETDDCACFNRSISSNQLLSVTNSGVATSLAVPSVSQRTWDIFCSHGYHLISKTCSDMDAVDSCYRFLVDHNCLVEPACGAALSTVYDGTLDMIAESQQCDLNIVVIVSGGRSMDMDCLLSLRQFMLPHQEDMSENIDQFRSLDLNNEYHLPLTINDQHCDDYYQRSTRYNSSSPVLQLSNYFNPTSSNYASAHGDHHQTEQSTKWSFNGNNIDGTNPPAPIGYYRTQSMIDDNKNITDLTSPVHSNQSDKENRIIMTHR